MTNLSLISSSVSVFAACVECGECVVATLDTDEFGSFLRGDICDDCVTWYSDLAAELQSEF